MSKIVFFFAAIVIIRYQCFDSIMCLLFVYLNDEESSDGYRLILVNNRDEEWDRPTKQLQFWTDHTDCISGMYDFTMSMTHVLTKYMFIFL